MSRNAIELTSGTKCSAPRSHRQVKRSTTSDTAVVIASAARIASGQGTPAWISAQVDMPAIMNSPGMLKFRKLSTPMLSVSATATIA